MTTSSDALADALVAVLDMERDAAGWTTKALGERLGLSEQTVQRYLTRRERPMPVSFLTRTASVIGVPLADILADAQRRVDRGQSAATEAKGRDVAERARRLMEEQSDPGHAAEGAS